MAEKDIIQNMILQPGQSQDERMPEELGIHFADVDEHTTEDLLLFTKKFAKFINYYRDNILVPGGDWFDFFSYNENTIKQLMDNQTGDTSPHLALFLAFLELYKRPQEVINRITGRHLDFYYKDVLRLVKKAPVPDKAHVLLELKKNVPPVEVSPDHQFSAGKDVMGVELVYAPTHKTVINTSKVDSLRSIFLDNRGRGTVRYAPIANSLDGVGGELKGNEARWYGFGHVKLPPAEVGFAIVSPVLRMQEGIRKVVVTLTLGNVDSSKLNDAALNDAFEVFVTGEEKWLGPYSIFPKLSSENILQFDFIVPESEKAVVDYDAAIHGYYYTAQTPIIQVLLKEANSNIGYSDFRNVTVKKAKVEVDVSNITSLHLESDVGVLDPKKSFLPFGSQPFLGSRFMVGYPEALSKKLSLVTIEVNWKGAPSDFSKHYEDYGEASVKNSYFTATISFRDGGGWINSSSKIQLFESKDAQSKHPFIFTSRTPSSSPAISEGIKVYALHTAGSSWALQAASRFVMHKPVFKAFKTLVPEMHEGFITFTLEKDFLHSAYRLKYIENVMKYSKEGGSLVILNEPYTPAIQSISLSYKARSDEVSISSNLLDDFSNSDLQFYHISYFGQMREHSYQRNQFAFLTDKSVSLLPVYIDEGELIIGFKELRSGDSVSVLFQVAEGSDDPDAEQEDVTWFVLCDNYWKKLDSSAVVLDTTNQLLTSGIITFSIPAEATVNNTILPPGRIWIKAAVRQNVKAVCQLIEIMANAVEVQFVDHGNDPSHLLTALGKGSISKFRNGLSVVKSIRQPYASFGGCAVESDDAFYTRVSERLRHKNRCITAWDYERIILEAFPKVHKVKCIPHAKEDRWLVPGNVLIVVIPDMKNKNAMDPLQPKVDADTISRITSYIQEHMAMQVKVKVKNPCYQNVQFDFKVKFYDKYEFNYYSEQLKQELIQFLSPWAFKTDYDISFGGKVYKSVVLDFVEEREYVDYITDFRMYTYTGEIASTNDVNVAQPERPDAVLVSAGTHIISKTETQQSGEI